MCRVFESRRAHHSSPGRLLARRVDFPAASMNAARPHLAVFRLAEVAEVETLIDGEPADLRIEVFEDTANPGQFLCRT